jgi:hypothetical protein
MQVQEHEFIPSLERLWGEGMHLPAPEGYERWFFRWEGSAGYRASYVLGAQWLDQARGLSLVVSPKQGCARIDFLQMFGRCLASGIESKALAQIYSLDLEQPRIKAPQLQSVLSPLILAHFLSVIQELLQRGLKRGYVPREENLKKVKGRLAISLNERCNIQRKRLDKFYCRYQEYSEDIPENRILKKALRFAQQVLYTLESAGLRPLQEAISRCLSSFARVGDEIEVWELKQFKTQKLYQEYPVAIQLAQTILRLYDYSLTKVTAREELCPVFWLDMPLLYEHYVLGLLREAYGDRIEYQKEGATGCPDFVCYQPPLVMDTKYKPHLAGGKLDTDIVRQLAGYARDRRLFSEAPTVPIPCPTAPIPCLVIYPTTEEAEPNPFAAHPLEDFLCPEREDKDIWGFYRLAVPLPTLSSR